jgi:DNA-binding MarR family transcriptional regulator
MSEATATSTGWLQPSTEQALQLAFVHVGRRLRAAFRTDPAAVGVLHALATSGGMRVSALARALVLDISTTSRHVSALESDGLVAREVDPADRRACLVAITAAGAEFLTAALLERAAVIQSATREWPAEDVTTLIRLLSRLADDLTEAPKS